MCEKEAIKSTSSN